MRMSTRETSLHKGYDATINVATEADPAIQSISDASISADHEKPNACHRMLHDKSNREVVEVKKFKEVQGSEYGYSN